MDLPPTPPTDWPIVGCTPELLGTVNNSKELFKLICRYGEYCEQRGGVIHSFLGPFLVFVVTDPDDIITVLNTCLEKNWVYEFARSWLGDGLVTVTTKLSIWRRHRRIIARAFNQQVLDGYMDIFNKRARSLVNEMTAKVESGPFNHTHLLEDFALKTMYQTTMEFSEESLAGVAGREVKEALRSMLRIVAARFQNMLLSSPLIYNFTSLRKEEVMQKATLDKICTEVVNNKRLALKNKEKSPSKFKSFLELLLELPADEAFTEKEIQDEVETMIVAGSDTTQTMLGYCLMLLGTHQDIQDQLYEEIKLCGTSDVEKQDLSRLVLAEAVLLETMRLFPILAGTMRYASTDVKLKNCTIPAGTTVMLLLYVMHRSTKYWGPDANEFVPQRWLPSPPPIARAFAGFSIGKRGCIGRTYAMMSMKTTLVHLLRRFRISADISKLELQVDSFLKPASGCEISLQLREQ
ncbi:cytochrome p450 domain-containing protein [Phthorimaea operculella]|nr:cytochrome p450 domain-containing protein [Phthorimaea operculella]